MPGLDELTRLIPSKLKNGHSLTLLIAMVVSQTGWKWVRYGERMCQSRPALFRGRHFQGEIIVLCVRWYLRYPLSYRDLEEMRAEEMRAERGLTLDHSTIARYGPILQRVDETYLRVAGKWTYYAGRSTRQDTPLTSCFRRTGIVWLPKAFSGLRSPVTFGLV
jgi:hypothetical protein